MAGFDPETFLDQAAVEEPMATSRELVPEGWYTAEVRTDGVQIRHIPRDEKDDLYIMEVQWEIDDPTAREVTELPNPTVRQSVFLDIDEEGNLASGKNKNTRLGKLREALGQNDPGQRWTPRMLEGARASVRVAHEPRKNDPDTVDESVVAVRSLT